MKIGYACINTELQKAGIKTTRSLMTKTLEKKGWIYYNELVLSNVRDLNKILEWNEKNGIRAFRMSSDLFPLKHLVGDMQQLKYWSLIHQELIKAGNFCKKYGHRISFHASAYCIPASQNHVVVKNSLQEMDFLATILDFMELEASPYHKVNVHLGTFKPSKAEAAKRFIKAFDSLRSNTKRRITIENDDSINGFSVDDLSKLVYPYTNTPIVLDYFHHGLNTGGLTLDEVIKKSTDTWPAGMRPMTHHSSSAKLNEDSSKMAKAHADYIYCKIPNDRADTILEAKAKEKAVLKYRFLNS